MAQRGWVTTALMILLVLIAGAGAYFYWSLNDELSQMTSAYEETLAGARQGQQALADLQAEQERLRQQLLRAQERLEQRTTSADQLETELNDTRRNLTGARQQIIDLERRIETLKKDLAVAETLASDRGEQLAHSQEQVAELTARRQDLEASLATAREEQTRARAQADELEDTLETARAELDQTRGQVEQRKAALDEVAAERQSVAEQYRQAREQLALQQVRSQNASETIAELEARLQREQSAMNDLQARLQALSNEKQTLVSRLEDGTTVIKLPEKIGFDFGSARIGEPGRQTLQLLANALESFPDHTISVQGHSDSRPISRRLQFRYPTNWELSASRAASAVRVLRDTGIAAERMQAVGYADTRPLVEETNDASRRMNRRIEVLLYPDELQVKVDSALNPESADGT